MKVKVKKVNLMKSISKVVVVLAFLTAILGIETQVVAQIVSYPGRPAPPVNYSNSVITTDYYTWANSDFVLWSDSLIKFKIPSAAIMKG